MTKLWWVLWRREAKRARALRTTLYLECLGRTYGDDQQPQRPQGGRLPGAGRRGRKRPSWNQGLRRFSGRFSRSSSLFLSGRSNRLLRWIMAM